MKAFLATVLGVIAVGVLLIAYGLLAPRAIAAPGDLLTLDQPTYPGARAYYASERVPLPDNPRANGYVAPVPARTAPARSATVRSARLQPSDHRDWKKTALVIGGSTAAGAGLGGIIGGGKGAAIGAAIGGGASTLWEALRK